MLELAEKTGSLDQVAQYEMVLSHRLEKLGVNQKRWHHADAFTGAIEYARTGRSGFGYKHEKMCLWQVAYAILCGFAQSFSWVMASKKADLRGKAASRTSRRGLSTLNLSRGLAIVGFSALLGSKESR